jgi:hypothetical protein
VAATAAAEDAALGSGNEAAATALDDAAPSIDLGDRSRDSDDGDDNESAVDGESAVDALGFLIHESARRRYCG